MKVINSMVLVMGIVGSFSAFAADGGGGGEPQGSTKSQVHAAVGIGSQNIKATLTQLSTLSSSSSEVVLRDFFIKVVSEFQNEKLLIRTGMDRIVTDKDGKYLYTISNGVCYDEQERPAAVYVKPVTSPEKTHEIDVCLSEAKLSQLKPAELNKQVTALLAFAVATGHGYKMVDAIKVQYYVLQNTN